MSTPVIEGFLDYRAPRLADRYAVPQNRERLATAHALWRADLCAATNAPTSGGLASDRRYAMPAPVRPNHLLGDASSQASRAAYARDMSALRLELTRQATQRVADALFAKLLGCITSVQANEQLAALREYALAGALPLLDARSLVERLGALRLPFERLLRNVWTPGPEAEFDVLKASLIGLFEEEDTRRRTEAAREAKVGTVRYGPNERVSSLRKAAVPVRAK